MDQWIKSGTSSKRKYNEKGDDFNGSKTLIPKTRKYSAEYLSLGFSCTFISNVEHPLCVICHLTLSNDSMKPAKLRRHFESRHKEYISKPLEFFKTKLYELQESQKIIKKTGTTSINKQALTTSFEVSLLIAKSGKPHTIAENLILPAAKAIILNMIGSNAAKDLNLISLSNDTVKNRISEMSQNIHSQLIERVLNSPFYSLQIDDSTDVCNNANLLSFIRYEFCGKLHEDFLFCKLLPTRTTGEEIFICVDEFIKSNGLDWSKCIGISTDGAPAMRGTVSGFKSFVNAVAENVVWKHCCIHREALVTKKIPNKLKITLDEIVSVINFIRARPLNCRLYKVLCEEMGSEHKQLLLHAEVRWLSRGKILNRVFEMRDEVTLFLIDQKNFYLKDRFLDFSWLAEMAYLCDIYGFLNEVNLSFQGTTVNIFKVEDKVEAMIKKIGLWTKRLERGILDSFPTLHEFIESSDQKLAAEGFQIFIEHLKLLKENIRDYFPIPIPDREWIRDPFHCKTFEVQHLDFSEQDQLAELSSDISLKNYFDDHILEDFWLHIRAEYPVLAEKAIIYLLPFCTTYLCERAFSMLLYLKNRYRNRLDVESELRLNISSIEPKIEMLVTKKQCHPSHRKK